MQINNNGITNNTANSNAGTQKTGAAAKADNSSNTAVASDKGDSVELSQEARVLTGLESKIASAADVDTNRVESIRQAIADGSYSVDADSIASKMMASDELF